MATLALSSVAAWPALAQVGYAAANAKTSLSPLRHGFLSFDLAETELGVTLLNVRPRPCGSAACARDFHFSIHASAAARKGETNVFSRIDFNTGYELGGRILYRFGASTPPAYHAVFVAARYETTERKTVLFQSDTVIAALDDVTQHTWGLALGYNHAFRGGQVVGVSVEGRRDLSSPGFAPRQQVCTTAFFGGTGIPVPLCRYRYVGPLADMWSAHVRGDAFVRIANIGSGSRTAKVGLLSAASVDLLEEANAALNLAVGPALYPPGHPGQPFVALVFEVSDALDANHVSAGVVDRLRVRIVAGVPFSVILSQ